MLKAGRASLSGVRRMGPTITLPSSTSPVEAVPVRTWRDRVVRTITDEEEQYEMLRMRKAGGSSSLKLKGKQSVQLARRERGRRDAHHDAT